MSPSKTILISNDDGIDAPGLQALAEAMEEFGTTYVVAPDRERSGSSHSLTLHRPMRIHPRGLRRYAVDGTPTDCVYLGILEILKHSKPDIVVSGINTGPNMGDDVIYSGTVSAAMEGALLGIPSVAFSLATQNGKPANFKPAAYFAKKVARKILADGLPKDVVINVNVPNIEGDKIDAYEITRLGKRRFSDAVAEKLDPRGRKYYWIGGTDLGFDDSEGSDSHAVGTWKKVSITPIDLDLTHDRYMGKLKEWIL